PRCIWTLADETCLFTYIKTNCAKSGDGLNFDKSFWAQAAIDIAQSTTGAAKTADSCATKWSQLHATYNVVDRVTHYSGVAWSTDCGTDIIAESEGIWADIIKVSMSIPSAKPYKNKGWVPYNIMCELLPSKASGGRV
ncbi:hypothetical protein BDR04DRAFT_951835, partial [Suillus decipiens]